MLAMAALGAPAAAVAQEPPVSRALHEALGKPDNLTISGGVRLQIESIDGQYRPDAADSDTPLLMRTKLAVEYDAGPVRIGGELWDGRVYGQKSNSSAGTTEVNALEVVQAYLAFDLAEKATLGVGRITLDLGSRRLVSRQNFRNTTNAFAGVHLHLGDDDQDRLDIFWTMPQLREPNDPEGIRNNRVSLDPSSTALQFFGMSYEAPIASGFRAEAFLYGLTERDTLTVETANRRLITPGARLYRLPKAGLVDLDLDVAIQRGRARRSNDPQDLVNRDVKAWAMHGEIGYTFPTPWQPRLSIVYDHGSGNRGSDTITRFDTLYGARRFDFGPTSFYGLVSRINSVSPGVRAEAKPHRRLNVFKMYRAIWLDSASDAFAATRVRDAQGQSGRFVGHQFEARALYDLIPKLLQLDVGGALLWKGRFLRDAPNAPDTGNTRYA